MNFPELNGDSFRAVVAEQRRGPSIGLEMSSDVVDLYHDDESNEEEEEAIYTAMPQGEAVEEYLAEERAALSAAQSLSRPVPPPPAPEVTRRRHQRGGKRQKKSTPKKICASKNERWAQKKYVSLDEVGRDRKQVPKEGFRALEKNPLEGNANRKRKRPSNDQTHSIEAAGKGTPTSNAHPGLEIQSSPPEPGLSSSKRKKRRKRKRKGGSDEQAQGEPTTNVTEAQLSSMSRKTERNRLKRQRKREFKRRKAQEAKESSEAEKVKAAQLGEADSLEKDPEPDFKPENRDVEPYRGLQAAKEHTGFGDLEVSNQERSSCSHFQPQSIGLLRAKTKPQRSQAAGILEESNESESSKVNIETEVKSDMPASIKDDEFESRSGERKPRAFSTESKLSCDSMVQSHEHVTLQDMREFWDEANSKIGVTNLQSKSIRSRGGTGTESQPSCASMPRVDKPAPRVSQKEVEYTARDSIPMGEKSASTVHVRPTATIRKGRGLQKKAEHDVIDLSSEADKPAENVDNAKPNSAQKSWQSTCVIIDSDSNDEDDDPVTVVRVKSAPPSAKSTARQERTYTKSSFHYSPEWFSRPRSKPKKRPMMQQHKNFNFEFSTEAAQREQERLFAEAAARVREKGLQGNLHVQSGDGPIFTRPVTDLSKLNENHWKWQDPYSRLGLPRGASLAMIKNQYRRLARRYHPDKSKLPDTASRFQAVTEAYHNLAQRSTVI